MNNTAHLVAVPTVPASVLPARAEPTALINDFSDRLSPILVKELRQGLRQPTFVIAFLCLQVLLCIVVLVSVITADVGSAAGLAAGSTVSGFFFVLLAIAILIVQPLRGLGALATEIKADTLDLLLLTRLNSWRITFGKWLALVSQSALLVVAVFPYLILRYYLGGMQLFSELLALLTLFIMSASLTGVTVGFSATASVVIRGLVAVGILAALLIGPNALAFSMVRGGRGSPFALTLSTSTEVAAYAGVMVMLAFFGYYLLEMGATQISPPSENRSTCKRLVGLATLGLLVWLLPREDNVGLYICWLLVASLLVADALTERPEFTASVLRPFRRLGPLRHPAGVFLLPGWASGIFLALLLAGLTLGLFLAHDMTATADQMLVFGLLWLASLLLPAVVTSLFLRKTKNLFTAYIVVLIASLIVALVFFIIGEVTNSIAGMIALVPVCPALGVIGYGEFKSADAVLPIALSSCGILWGILFVRSLPHWARIRALDRSLDPKPVAAVVPDTADVA